MKKLKKLTNKDAKKYGQWHDDVWYKIQDGVQRLMCCDCGLVHDYKFRVRGKDGKIIRTAKVEIKVFRNDRCTGQIRRWARDGK